LDFITLCIISVGLAMDCFAVSLGVGTANFEKDKHTYFRLPFHFGLFQGGMAFFGWLAGQTIVTYIAAFDHWIAFGLLAFVGVRMILEGINPDCESCPQDPSKGKMLVVLCVATSIDALAVGLSMALVEVQILLAVLIIALGSVFLSLLGLRAGSKLGIMFGKRMEIFGGVLLIGIGIRILLTHLL
jgi:manganese efflux pump family protein